MKKFFKNFSFSIIILSLAMIFSATHLTLGWVQPTCNPPDCTGALGSISTGNLSIGTTAPEGLFQIASSTATDVKLVIERYNLYRSAILRFNTTSVGSDWSVGLLYGGGAVSDDFGISKTNLASDAKFILKDGTFNVGIGTTAPAQKLSVVGTIESTTGGFKFPDGTTQTTAGGGNWTSGSGTIYATTITDSVGIGLTSPDTNYKLTTSGGGVKAENSSASQPSVYSSNAGGGPALVTGTGNVGIGTTAPAKNLEIQGSTNAVIRVAASQNPTTYSGELYGSYDANNMTGFRVISGSNIIRWSPNNSAVYVGASDAMTIKSGNVGIGTTAPSTKLSITGVSPADTFGGQIKIAGSETTGAINTGGAIYFEGHDGSSARGLAYIRGLKENSTVANYASFISLGTRTNGVGTIDERMRISSTGNVGIGTTAPSAGTLTMTGKYLLLSDSQTKFGDSGLIGGGAANGNTGLDYYTGKYFAISESGTARIRISSGGNVGIGTTAPAQKLSFGSNATIGVDTSDASDTGYAILSGGGGTPSETRGALFQLNGNEKATNPGDAYLYAGNVAGGDLHFLTGSAASDAMTIINGGNVGIGITAPVKPLDVNGTIRSYYAGSAVKFWDIGYESSGIRYTSDANSNQLRLDMSSIGNGANPAISMRTSNTSALDTNAMVILGNGNVGIGTTAPGYKLDVNGDMNIAAGSVYKIGGVTQTGSSKWTAGTGDDIYRAAGNVGIGTTAPGSKLHISDGGTTPTLGTNSDQGLIIQNNSGTGDHARLALIAGATTGISIIDFGDTNDLDAGQIYYKHSDDSMRFVVNTAEKLTILNSGNVGIGTTVPATLLEVEQNVAPGTAGADTNPALSVHNPNSSAGARAELHLQPQYDSYLSSVYDYTSATHYGVDWSFNLWNKDGDPAAANNTVMIVKHEGIVGIGTTAPDTNYKLTTSGGGVKAENSSASQPAIYSSNAGGGPALVTGTGNVGIGTTNPIDILEAHLGTNQNLLIRLGSNMVSGATGVGIQSLNDAHNTNSPITVAGNPILLANGNVGIGTTGPNELVEIANADGAVNSKRLIISDGGGAERKVLLLQQPGATTSYGRIIAYKYGTGAGYLPLVLQDGGGNVGIGTTNPDTALTVGDGSSAKTVHINSSLTSGGIVKVQMSSRSNGQSQIWFGDEGSDYRGQINFLASASSPANSMQLISSGSVILQPTTGNVGIGTTGPAGIFQIGDLNTAAGGMLFLRFQPTSGTPYTYFTATRIAGITGKIDLSCASDGDPNRQIAVSVRLAYPTGTATVITTSSQNATAAWTTSGSNLQVNLTSAVPGIVYDCTLFFMGNTTTTGG